MGHHGERFETGAGNGDRVSTCIEACHMETTCAHRLDLCRIGLYREKLYLLTRHLLHVFKKAFPDLGVHGWIFDRRIGEDQRTWIDLLAAIRRCVATMSPSASWKRESSLNSAARAV